MATPTASSIPLVIQKEIDILARCLTKQDGKNQIGKGHGKGGQNRFRLGIYLIGKKEIVRKQHDRVDGVQVKHRSIQGEMSAEQRGYPEHDHEQNRKVQIKHLRNLPAEAFQDSGSSQKYTGDKITQKCQFVDVVKFDPVLPKSHADKQQAHQECQNHVQSVYVFCFHIFLQSHKFRSSKYIFRKYSPRYPVFISFAPVAAMPRLEAVFSGWATDTR